MSIAGRKGMNVVLDKIAGGMTSASSATSSENGGQRSVVATPSDQSSALPALFSEELGAVIEIDKTKLAEVMTVLSKHGVSDISHLIGNTSAEPTLNITLNGQSIYSENITTLNRAWSELSYQMQSKRDNPKCAQEEYDALLEDNAGIIIQPTFDVAEVEATLLSLSSGQDRATGVSLPHNTDNALASPFSENKASTAKMRWRSPSTVPASKQSTCT